MKARVVLGTVPHILSVALFKYAVVVTRNSQDNV